MEDIELVIKIPKSTYKVFKNLSKIIGVLVYEKDILTLIKAIKNGTPLPEGHGRIGDLTKLYNKIDKRNRENGKGKYTGILVLVDNAETIIEADKGE